MRAVGYFSDRQEGSAALGQQNRAFLEFCRRHGLEAGETFVESAATNGGARGFRELVRYLRAEGFHEAGAPVVVLGDLEVLGAEPRVAAVRCFQLEALGARVATPGEIEDPADALLSAWIRQDDGARLSDRVRSAMRRKAVKGEVLGRPPYGYKVGARRRLELEPEEAVVVRYIFRLYLQEKPEAPSGMGIRLIARRLNEEGLKTRRGGNWSMISIRDILRNRAYLGTYSRFGVRVPGSHPALVSQEDFRVVQDRLNARRTSYAPRVASHFLLSGVAHCGYCGNKLIGVSRRQSWKRKDGTAMSNAYRYYQCESRTNQSVCGYHTRRAADLEREVREAIASVTPGGAPTRDPSTRPRAVARVTAKLRAIERKLDERATAATKGRIDRDRLRAECAAAAIEQLALEDQLEAAEQAGPSVGSEPTAAADALLASWDAASFADLQASLREIVERITVNEEGVQVVLRES